MWLMVDWAVFWGSSCNDNLLVKGRYTEHSSLRSQG